MKNYGCRFRVAAFAALPVVLVFLPLGANAEERTITTNSVFVGESSWTVAEGDTEIVEGLVTASAKLTKYGKGTLALANPGNTFGGNIDVRSGILRADVQGALGSSKVTLSKSSSSTADRTNRLFLNAENAVFSNAIEFKGGTESAYAYAPLNVVKSCEIAGNITLASTKNYSITDDTTVKPSVVFSGNITTSMTGGSYLYLMNAGSFSFTGFMQLPVLSTASASSGYPGTVEICSSSNEVNTVHMGYANVHLRAKDAFKPTVKLNVAPSDANYARNDSIGGIYLHADQTIGCLTCTTEKYPITEIGEPVFSDGPVVLRVTGTTASPVSYVKFCNEVTLVKEGAADTVQVFGSSSVGRTHTTSGRLIVSNGTLRVAGGSKFANVPEVRVVAGTFDLKSTVSGSLTGVTNLVVEGGTFNVGASVPYPFAETVERVEVGAGGLIDAGSSLTITAGKLVIGGIEAGYGNFTSVDYPDNIGANVTFSVPRPEHVYTADSWIGGSSGNAIATAANWSGNAAPDLETGDFTPFFAASGREAVFNSAVSFFGIGFGVTNETSFTLAKGADDAGITLYDGGINVEAIYDGDEPLERAYTNEVPVSATATWWAFDIATNATFVSAGEVSGGGAPTIVKRGPGHLELAGDFAVGGDFIHSNGLMTIRGTLGVDNDNGTFNVKSKTGCMAKVILANANIKKNFVNDGSGSSVNTYWLTAAPGSTNVIEGLYKSGSQSQYFTMSDDSELTCSGGITLDNSFIVSGANSRGRFIIKDKPLVLTVPSKGTTSLSCDLVFDATGNNILSSLTAPPSGRYMEFRRDDVFAVCPVLIVQGSEIRLNSTHQSWGAVRPRKYDSGKFYPSSPVTGEYGSEFEITLGSTEAGLASTNVNCTFKGAVSLRMGGSGILLLTNSVSASCGNVTVTNGTLRFSADSSWLNGTNVVVSGTGKLEIPKAVFGRHAILDISDSGVISVASGTVQHFAGATVDGVRLKTGRYSYSRISEPSLRAHFDPDARGDVFVCNPAFSISFR